MDEEKIEDVDLDEGDDQESEGLVLNLFIEGDDFRVTDVDSLDDKAFLEATIDGSMSFYNKAVTDRLSVLDKKFPTPGDMADLVRKSKTAAKVWIIEEFKSRVGLDVGKKA